MLLKNLLEVLDNTENIRVVLYDHTLYEGSVDEMCIKHLYYDMGVCNIRVENNILVIEVLA